MLVTEILIYVMSEIKKIEELIPFVSRVVIGFWYRKNEGEKTYPYISNITPYLTETAKELGIDLDTLTNDLTSNLLPYYSDPYLGPMKSEEVLSHVIDDSRVVWLVEAVWDGKGKLVRKEKSEVWIRSDITRLYDTPLYGEKPKGTLKARTG